MPPNFVVMLQIPYPRTINVCMSQCM